jgi:hypothetical protein
LDILAAEAVRKRPLAVDDDGIDQAAPAKALKTVTLTNAELFGVLQSFMEKNINKSVANFYDKRRGAVTPPSFEWTIGGLIGKDQPVPSDSLKNRLHAEFRRDPMTDDTRFVIYTFRVDRPVEISEEYTVPHFENWPKKLMSLMPFYAAYVASKSGAGNTVPVDANILASARNFRSQITKSPDWKKHGVYYEDVLAEFRAIARPALSKMTAGLSDHRLLPFQANDGMPLNALSVLRIPRITPDPAQFPPK